jgi:hypothetical protein
VEATFTVILSLFVLAGSTLLAVEIGGLLLGVVK